MVQRLTVWSNRAAEINTGTNFLLCDGVLRTDALQAKMDAIRSILSLAGIHQLHVERDTFREFEHVVAAGQVIAKDFGTTVSSADFDLIMQYADQEVVSQAAAFGDNTTTPE